MQIFFLFFLFLFLPVVHLLIYRLIILKHKTKIDRIYLDIYIFVFFQFLKRISKFSQLEEIQLENPIKWSLVCIGHTTMSSFYFRNAKPVAGLCFSWQEISDSKVSCRAIRNAYPEKIERTKLHPRQYFDKEVFDQKVPLNIEIFFIYSFLFFSFILIKNGYDY